MGRLAAVQRRLTQPNVFGGVFIGFAKLRIRRTVSNPATPISAEVLLSALAAPLRGAVRITVTLHACAIIAACVFALAIGACVGAWSEGARWDVLVSWLLLAACAAIARGALTALGDVVAADAGAAMTRAARARILDQIESHGGDPERTTSAGGRVVMLIDRTADLAPHVSAWAPGRVVAVLGPLIVAGFVASQSLVAALVLLACVPLMPLFIWLTASETRAVAARQQEALTTLASRFEERGRHVGLIKSFNAVGREAAVLAHDAEELAARTLTVLRVAFLSGAALDFFAALSIALVAVYAGFKLLNLFPIATGEEITLAHAMTALILAPEFFAPLRRLSTLHHDRARASAAAQALSAWFATSQHNPAAPMALSSAPTIRFDAVLGVHGDGRGMFAKPLSFRAEPGQITLLWGASGAGKSSALRLLLGMGNIASGVVSIDDVALAPRQSLSGHVAWVGQTPWAMAGSVRDNLAIATPDATDAAMQTALHEAGLGAFISDRGLDAMVGRDGFALSGGERQRLSFARAILSGAPVWLLDEPSAFLDPDAEARLWLTLQALRRHRTIILASHAPGARVVADKVVALDGAAEDGV